jgi:3-oxoacyl-[acyl-carrier-protein] synthase III
LQRLKQAFTLLMSKITAAITAIGGYVPEKKLTNFDLRKIG